MPKPILRSQRKPIAAAESPTAGDGSACRARVRLQHKPIGIAESLATERAGAEMLKNPQSDHGSATRAGGCNTNPQLLRNLDCGSAGAEMQKPVLRNPIITGALRVREAAAQTHSLGAERRARGRLQHKPTGAAESPATGAQARRCSAARSRQCCARGRLQTHRCGGIYIGSRKPVEVWIVRGPRSSSTTLLVLRQASWAKEP